MPERPESMRALQYREIGKPPVLVEIARPRPGVGQVLIKMTAAGVCHSDVRLLDIAKDKFPYQLPLTLGHEAAGVVAEIGDGASGISIGDRVAVYGPRGCGNCVPCVRGAENYCVNAAAMGIRPPGLGSPGAMADYMLVDDVRHLVPLDGLDAPSAAALTDAGLTPFHAITSELSLLGPTSTATVVGVGGLGHLGIQILRALTSAQVLALDIDEAKLRLALEVGAHDAFLADSDAVAQIRSRTGGIGADVVFDFVGTHSSLEIARKAVKVNGSIEIVGLGGSVLPVGYSSTPLGARARFPYWGGRDELTEVLALARSGQIRVEVEKFAFEDAPKVYALLRAGRIRARAVVVF